MAAKKSAKRAAPGAGAKAASSAKVKKGAAKKPAAKKAGPAPRRTEKGAAPSSASSLIDARIREFPDWRGETLARMRRLIREADPDVVEEWKWETPVWSRDGILCTGETYKSVVKLTFAKGAFLPDPSRLFNSSLEGNLRRAIDLREGENVEEAAFQALVRAAAALNASKPRR